MQTIATDSIHLIIDVITPIAGVAITWVGLLIRNSILNNKLEVEAKSAEVKAELIAHNNQIKSDLRAHMASDEQQFGSIQKSLDRIENKVG